MQIGFLIDVIRYSNNHYRSFTLDGQRSYAIGCLNNPDIDLYEFLMINYTLKYFYKWS